MVKDLSKAENQKQCSVNQIEKMFQVPLNLHEQDNAFGFSSHFDTWGGGTHLPPWFGLFPKQTEDRHDETRSIILIAEHMCRSTFRDIINIFVICLMFSWYASNVIESTPIHSKILTNIYINTYFSEIYADAVKKNGKAFKKTFFSQKAVFGDLPKKPLLTDFLFCKTVII